MSAFGGKADTDQPLLANLEVGRRLLGDRPTTGAERKRRWRERLRERRPDVDPSGDGTAALMSRALPAPSTTEALDTAHGARRVEDEQ